MTDLSLIPPMLGVGGLVAAIVIYFIVKSYDEGDDRLKRIADQIHLGAMVFMRREYTMLSIFAAVLLVLIYFSPLGLMTAAAFLAGALSSAAAGCRIFSSAWSASSHRTSSEQGVAAAAAGRRAWGWETHCPRS